MAPTLTLLIWKQFESHVIQKQGRREIAYETEQIDTDVLFI